MNLLIALAWPSHVHHRSAHAWFSRKSKSGIRTCPLTQTGFVRISSNPKFTADAVAVADALELLTRITALPEHEFWPDDLSLADSLRRVGQHLATHRQVTDAYLAGLAAARGGILATFDRGAAKLWKATKLVGESSN